MTHDVTLLFPKQVARLGPWGTYYHEKDSDAAPCDAKLRKVIVDNRAVENELLMPLRM
jgi:hypothetical protein